MGKKKYKNVFDKMDWFDRNQFLEEQAGDYGIDLSEYSQFGSHSDRGGPTKDYTDLANVIAKRSYDNFSNRMALQEAALQGNRHAEKILGMNEGINQAAAAEKWMEKQHGKHVGGGDYTWGSDPAAVAQHFAEKSRNELLDASAKADTDTDVSSDYSADRAYELSPELNATIGRNQDFLETRLAGEIFKPIRTEPDESEMITQEILEAEEAEESNRENQFLFDYINTMDLA